MKKLSYLLATLYLGLFDIAFGQSPIKISAIFQDPPHYSSDIIAFYEYVHAPQDASNNSANNVLLNNKNLIGGVDGSPDKDITISINQAYMFNGPFKEVKYHTESFIKSDGKNPAKGPILSCKTENNLIINPEEIEAIQLVFAHEDQNCIIKTKLKK